MTQIRIKELRLEACHGVLPEEKVHAQPFVFDIILDLVDDNARQSDRLEDTVNYAAVCESVKRVVCGQTFNLLERLAYRVGEEILLDFDKVRDARVTVDKPHAPVNAVFSSMQVSVSVRRPRQVFLSLGSNLGDSRQLLERAVDELSRLPQTRLTGTSPLYVSAPLDACGEDFLNLCVRLETQLEPEALLLRLQQLERQAGRVREYPHAPRTLDIDILLFEGETRRDALLTLPHPRAFERRFVLEPLRDLDPLAGGFDIEAALSKLPDQACRRL